MVAAACRGFFAFLLVQSATRGVAVSLKPDKTKRPQPFGRGRLAHTHFT